MTPDKGRVLRAEDAVSEARRLTRELEALATELAKKGWRRRILIKVLTEKHGWSQHEVAAALGISQPRVHDILEDP